MIDDFPFDDDDSPAPDDQDDIIQLICPICHERHFEEVYVAGKKLLKWERKGVIATTWQMYTVEAYRCLHCDYLVMFGREKRQKWL